MTELEPANPHLPAVYDAHENPELVLPGSGELIDLRQPSQVAHGLHQIAKLKPQLEEIRAYLVQLLHAESQRQGTKTLHLDGYTATISGGEKTEWDIPKLTNGLVKAGLPLERLEQLIQETVTYKVDRAVARQLAAANPAYAKALAAAQQKVPASRYANVTPASR